MTQAIEHVVVLMLENRSFDHMLGYLKACHYPIEGLTGDESNPTDLNDVNNPAKRVNVSANANKLKDVLRLDPAHRFSDVNTQLFCNPGGPPARPEKNGGFIYNYDQQAKVTPLQAREIMKCFDAGTSPVLSTLAKEFAICDRWFSSVPGPTWPNRLFTHASTSSGYVDNSVHVYNSRTIFENLSEARRTWAVYYHDTAQSMWFNGLQTDEAKSNFLPFRDFRRDALSGSLPNYSFIEPRFFNFFSLKANDQHPPHSVDNGEQLIATIYNVLRRSRAWNTTMLLITYDEHGGTYDHIHPDIPAIPPDAKTALFGFDRYGIRVPAVVISPYVPKGHIENTLFDHTSIPATLKELFRLPRFLTARDAKAATFCRVASLTSARTDTPDEIAAPRPQSDIEDERLDSVTILNQKESGEMSAAPLSDLQQAFVSHAHALDLGDDQLLHSLRLARRIETEHDAAVYVREVTRRHLSRRGKSAP